MKTSVAVLAEKLGNNCSVWCSSTGYALTLEGIRLWSDQLGEARHDALWVCDPDDAEQLARAGASVAVACGEDENADALADRLFAKSGETAEILVAHTKSANELANRLMDVKEALDAWDAALTEEIIARKPLQNILEIAVKQLVNPVAVFDETSGLMSYAGEVSGDYQETIWGVVLDKGRAPVGYYTAEERTQISANIANSAVPTIIRPKRSPLHENLSLCINEDGQVLGMLAQVDLLAPFDSAQISLAMHVRDRLGEMFRTTIAGQHHRSPIGHTLRLLIQGDTVEERIVRYQLERKSWHINDRYCLAVMPLPDNSDSPYSNPYRAEIMLAYPGSIVIDQDRYLVILIHLDQSQPTASREEFIEMLRHRDSQDIPCGVSDEFEFLHARSAWRQARIAVREGNGNGRKGVSTYDDVFFSDFLHQMEQTTPLDVPLHPMALRIAQSERGDEVLSCIFAYVMNGCNVSRAARALYMHRNTLEYRMTSIQQRWSLDMNSMDEDELLRFALSCRLLMQQSLER
jgi:aromatic ring-cleaving dioxygenase